VYTSNKDAGKIKIWTNFFIDRDEGVILVKCTYFSKDNPAAPFHDKDIPVPVKQINKKLSER